MRRGREGTKEFAQKGPTLKWLRRYRSEFNALATSRGLQGSPMAAAAKVAVRNADRAIQLVKGVKRVPKGVADFLLASGGR